MPSRPQLHLLVVEDNEDDVFLIREAIAQGNVPCTIDVVHDGTAALRYLRREGEFSAASVAGLVLLDINLPRKNGFDVLQEVKADPALRFIPVIIFTTSDAPGDVYRSYALGACSHIVKPPDFEVFRHVIGQLVTYWTLVCRVPGAPRPG